MSRLANVERDDDFEEEEPDVDRDQETAEDLAPTKQMAYSATRLEALGCPWRWREKYVRHRPELGSPVLSFGSFVHSVLELYVQLCRRASVAGDAGLVNAALDTVYRQMPTVTMAQYEEIHKFLHWFAVHHVVELDHVVDVELEWAATADWQPCDWNDASVRWRGRIDLLEVDGSVLTLIDYKTHRAAQSQSTVEQAIATKLYPALALSQNPMVTATYTVYAFVRHGIRRAVRHDRLEVPRNREQLDREADRVDRLLEETEDDSAWPAIPGSNCSVCGYVSVCPARSLVGELRVPQTQAEADALAGQVAYMQAAMKQDKLWLREWVAAVGPARSGGMVFDHWRGAQWKLDEAKLLAACVEHKIPLEEVMTFDRVALQALARKRAPFGAAIEGLIQDVGKTTFALRKAPVPGAEP